ncbi:barstar family protein [Seonamhaeicola sp.]|uniref:barstar family protein n=1 Tax=Seonamhaeicola sp. TaxID=1912245 RepID=UPI00261DDA95|nr:barstar family protein [Seonamhaeicola sp.]
MIIDKDSFVGSINGLQCPTKSDALREFGNSFLFPKYYGNNLDALEDCLTDLSWIKQSKVILVINDFDLFLTNETEEFKSSFLELLYDVQKEWNEDQNKEDSKQFYFVNNFLAERSW